MKPAELTPEIKQDLQLIKNRNFLDPKHHFKKLDWGKNFPKVFQVGTIIDNPVDFYSSRFTKKERKGRIIDSLDRKAFKSRFDKIQSTKGIYDKQKSRFMHKKKSAKKPKA
eukprot:Colp12_sorted_trinity150504_noHs@34575